MEGVLLECRIGRACEIDIGREIGERGGGQNAVAQVGGSGIEFRASSVG
jgi:hypothetical protein